MMIDDLLSICKGKLETSLVVLNTTIAYKRKIKLEHKNYYFIIYNFQSKNRQ